MFNRDLFRQLNNFHPTFNALQFRSAVYDVIYSPHIQATILAQLAFANVGIGKTVKEKVQEIVQDDNYQIVNQEFFSTVEKKALERVDAVVKETQEKLDKIDKDARISQLESKIDRLTKLTAGSLIVSLGLVGVILWISS